MRIEGRKRGNKKESGCFNEKLLGSEYEKRRGIKLFMGASRFTYNKAFQVRFSTKIFQSSGLSLL